MAIFPSPLISDISDGRCLPFVGAGFSMNAKISELGLTMPDWPTLGSILALDAETLLGAQPQAVAERYEKRFGRVQLIEAIRKALHLGKAEPGDAHLAFVDLPFDTVYTTNFDLLLEDAYAQKGRTYRSLVGELQMPFHAGKLACTIIKMHGDLRHEEHMIVTERDYTQFMKKYPVIATHLSAMLITRTPLFIGYSLSDPDFIHIRKVIRSRLGQFERMSYVIQFDKSPAEIEAALKDNVHIISLDTNSGRPIDILLQELFKETLEKLDTNASINLRASRPDVFEEVEPEIVERAVQSSEFASILTSTSNLCFVMMPFGHIFDEVYSLLIRPAAEQFGLKVLRADEIWSTGAIMEQIRAAIQQSRLCIVDLSSKNPNVLYELGVAQTMGKPTILLSRDVADLPFDIAHQRIVIYPSTNPAEVRQNLEAAIKLALTGDRFEEVQRMIGAGLYRAAIALLGVILEQLLHELIKLHSRQLHQRPMGITQMAKVLIREGVITEDEFVTLTEIQNVRNRAVHELAEPSVTEAQFALSTVRDFVERHSNEV